MRRLLTTVVAAVAVATFPQDGHSSELVSFRCPASKVAQAVDKLNRQQHLHLRVGSSFGNDVVVVAVSQVPLESLLTHLADALDAQWNRGILIRPRHALAMYRREDAERLRRISVSQREQLQMLEAQGEWNDRLAQELAYSGVPHQIRRPTWPIHHRVFAPIERAMLRLFADLPKSALARMHAGARRVFSSHPTSAQVPFGPAARGILAQFKGEQAAWVAYASLRVPSAKTMEGMLPFDYSWEPYPSRPAVALLTVSRRGNIYQLQLQLADSNLRRLDQCSTQIETVVSKPIPAASDAPFKFSPITAALLQRYRRVELGEALSHMVDENGLDQFLTSCETEDPLRVVVSDAVFSLGERTRTNVVAVPSDQLLFKSIEPAMDGHLNSKEFLQIAGACELEVSDRNGWLTIRPSLPVTVEENRAGRRELSDLLSSILRTHQIALDPFARLYASYSGWEPEDEALHYLWIAVPHTRTNFDAGHDQWMKLYGSMSQPQKARAANGLPYAQMNHFQKLMVQELLQGPGLTSVGNKEHDRQWDLTVHDPTLVLPRPLPSGTKLTMRRSTTPVAYGGSQHYGPDALSKGTLETVLRGEVPIYSQFWIAPQTTVTIEITSGGFRQVQQLYNTSYDPTAPLTLDQFRLRFKQP
jgi:hypothetical protein